MSPVCHFEWFAQPVLGSNARDDFTVDRRQKRRAVPFNQSIGVHLGDIVLRCIGRLHVILICFDLICLDCLDNNHYVQCVYTYVYMCICIYTYMLMWVYVNVQYIHYIVFVQFAVQSCQHCCPLVSAPLVAGPPTWPKNQDSLRLDQSKEPKCDTSQLVGGLRVCNCINCWSVVTWNISSESENLEISRVYIYIYTYISIYNNMHFRF